MRPFLRRRFAGVTTRLFRSRHDDGQSLAEYGLILALVAAVCVGALSAFGGAIAGSVGFTLLPAVLSA